ncbi:unnamed protein product [Rhizoctonia solani]|uniref:Uncharacterized protein n=1 Tax=Rhizoctonia solani TaxID=456999 RepID=A0A8H3H7S6_9AGAM|nr:unnamed protein product [Rhizoctonia solani]
MYSEYTTPFNVLPASADVSSGPVTQLLEFCSTGLKPTPGAGDKLFDWGTFKRAVDQQAANKLTFDEFRDLSSSPTLTTVEAAASQCAGFLSDSVDHQIPEGELKTHLTNLLTNLSAGKKSGWASFIPGEPSGGWIRRGPDSSEWQLRLALLNPKSSSSSDIQAVLATLKFGGNVAKEEDWYKLDREKSQKLSFNLDVMKLIVSADFHSSD